jgi:hypothetical protein
MSSIAAIDRRCFLPPAPAVRPREDSPWLALAEAPPARDRPSRPADVRPDLQDAEPALAI